MQTKYGLYIAKGTQVVRIPVNPQEYPIQMDGNNDTYDVMGIGEIMIPRIPKLRVIPWESYFPVSRDDPLALNTGAFWTPDHYIRFFRNAMIGGQILRFVANRYMEDGAPLFDTNIQCLVSKFEISEKGGMTGDVFYSVELTEYRNYAPAVVQIKLPDPPKPAEPQQPAKVETQPARETPPAQLAVGSIVICNGNYYYSSYKDEPHGTFSNFRGKVAKIVTNDPSRACPVLIVTESGGGRGWVAKSQVQVVT